MLTDLLGQLMQSGMTNSGNSRVRHALGPQGLGQPQGPLDAILGGGGSAGNPLDKLLADAGPSGGGATSSGGGLGGVLSGLAESAQSMFGDASRSVQSGNPLAVGGLGALAGALLGGGGGAAKGAVGGGALALLGTLAMSALKDWGQGQAPAPEEVAEAAPLGLREPQNAAEQAELEQKAGLVLRAMINAAKADGQIDRDEVERIVGKLREGGIDEQERAFVEAEMRKPLDVAGLARETRTPEQAVEVYAASLLAIEVDTEAERRYLSQLAQALGLHAQTVQRVHQMLGLA
jgi:uncharacterized membrane protein YebE (DUF533 family)